MRLPKKNAITVFSLLIISGCVSRNAPTEEAYTRETKEGYELAKYHCGTCHAFVHADRFDQKTWTEHILPDMAVRLGIEVLWGKKYVDVGGNGSSIAFKDWIKIVEYYEKNAVEQPLTSSRGEKVLEDSSLFKVVQPKKDFEAPVRTVLTIADTATNYIYTSDAGTRFIYKWSNKLQVVDSLRLSSPIVDASFFYDRNGKRRGVFTAIGTLLPSQIPLGEMLEISVSDKMTKPYDTIGTSLPRTVQAVAEDFNNDSLTDWLSCSYGSSKGGLYWFRKIKEGGYSKEKIIEIPGAIRAVVEDFNGDGWKDAMVLFAHDNESIRLFINDQKGSFTAAEILSFPPYYGSTSFELIDFNKDGLKDIIYTCGDNADVSPVLKPYHGIYIYLNKGEYKYEKAFFYHINGCTKAVTADFDADGDLDIASIAFYADLKDNPFENFIYLRQDSKFRFTALSPRLNKSGRWLTMDVSDYDDDGDSDIILGNFSTDFLIKQDIRPKWDSSKPFTVLENTTKK